MSRLLLTVVGGNVRDVQTNHVMVHPDMGSTPLPRLSTTGRFSLTTRSHKIILRLMNTLSLLVSRFYTYHPRSSRYVNREPALGEKGVELSPQRQQCQRVAGLSPTA